jgi:hypothetical protein
MNTKLIPPNITPGPWSAQPLDDPQWGVHGSGEWELVANTLHGNDSTNAKFIAAGPDMAEALARCLPDFEIDEDAHDGHVACEISIGDVKAIRAALLSAGYTLAADPE